MLKMLGRHILKLTVGVQERRGKTFLAHQVRKSKVFTWDRNSYLIHVILPMGRMKKENFPLNFVCIGCIGHHITLSLIDVIAT